MGAAASLLVYHDPNVVFVDDVRPKDPTIKGFSKQIFKRYEWPTLKFFCNTYNIQHVDVCKVFKRFLQYEEVYLLQFRVRMKDVRHHFSRHSRLEQEIADACIPLMFMKEFVGLDPAPPPCEDVSFARFIIMVYIFCAEQIPDAILGFVTFLRQKLHMSSNAKLHTYSLDQLLKVLLEDLQPSAAALILLDSISRLGKEDELSMLAIVRLGIKYPILFYVLERFRKHIRRIAFGDKFWETRSQMKLKIPELEGSPEFFSAMYKNEQTAIMETSRSIIADVVLSRKMKKFRITARVAPEVMYIDEQCLQRLKDLFGYEKSRQLALDSDIAMDCESTFVEKAFGENAPVPRPGWGFQVFPDGIPHPILALPEPDLEDDASDSEHGEEAAAGSCADGEGKEEDGPPSPLPPSAPSSPKHHTGRNEDPEPAASSPTNAKRLGSRGASVRWAEDEDADPVVLSVVTGYEVPQDEGQLDGEGQAAAGAQLNTDRDRRSDVGSSTNGENGFDAEDDNDDDLFERAPTSPACTELRSAPSFMSTYSYASSARPSSRGVPSAMGTHDEAEAARLSHSLHSEAERRVETILDAQMGREFRFDPATGKSAWVLSIVDQEGDLLQEYCGY